MNCLYKGRILWQILFSVVVFVLPVWCSLLNGSFFRLLNCLVEKFVHVVILTADTQGRMSEGALPV